MSKYDYRKSQILQCQDKIDSKLQVRTLRPENGGLGLDSVGLITIHVMSENFNFFNI